MKKLLVLLVVSVIVMATSIPVFAEVVVPEQSVGNVNIAVCAAFQRQRATGFACPEIAGYNCQWQQI